MTTMEICSGLQHFRLLRRITSFSKEQIQAQVDFEDWPGFTGLEAMAQLAAMHARQCLRFEVHAFLLKVTRCRLPLRNVLDGRFLLTANLRSRSSQAFGYEVAAQGPHDEGLISALIIGTQPYDDGFQKDILKPHYQAVWTKLFCPQAAAK